MSHADELARLRDAVVEAVRAADGRHGLEDTSAIEDALHALLASEAATCGKCEGRGEDVPPTVTICGDGEIVDHSKCPNCGGTGRKRQDRFRDDSATTPEGDER
jgi:hypothetical protein